MNKGAAAALEEEEDWRHARCDCTTVRRVRRRPATAKASVAAAAAATTLLGWKSKSHFLSKFFKNITALS